MTGAAAPSVEVCLRLAQVFDVSASRILRAAGKGSVADLIEDLYGKAAERRIDRGHSVTPDEVKQIHKLRRLKPRSRRAILILIEAADELRSVLDLKRKDTSKRGITIEQTPPKENRREQTSVPA